MFTIFFPSSDTILLQMAAVRPLPLNNFFLEPKSKRTFIPLQTETRAFFHLQNRWREGRSDENWEKRKEKYFRNLVLVNVREEVCRVAWRITSFSFCVWKEGERGMKAGIMSRETERGGLRETSRGDAVEASLMQTAMQSSALRCEPVWW